WLYKISVKKPPFKSNSKTPKIVFTAHGWVFNPTNYLGAPARWFYILLHKSAALFQHKIINVSEYDRALALRYKIAPAHKLITIHNGIDPNIPFLDKETARKDIIKKLKDSGFKISARGGSAFGGQDSRPWIGSIGRLTKEKDYGTFIEAAKMLPDAYFFIIGDGKEISNLKSKISNLKLTNRFFIVPPTGNDAQMLKAFDAFCMTSIKEGMPYVLLEAMAAGLPIVVTEAGGMPEAIKNNSNGMLVPLKDPEMLAQIISRLISGGRDSKNLGEKAVSAARVFFNAKKTIEATQKIYS
ncbi:MAG TPA: glycosyltransferase, partial [Candidatus Paceibacterota bacterium]